MEILKYSSNIGFTIFATAEPESPCSTIATTAICAISMCANTVKADEEIKKIIDDITNSFVDAGLVSEEDAQDVYADFVESVDDAIADIDEAELNTDAVASFISYVDGGHKVVGRELIVEDETLFEYKTATMGKKFATRAIFGDVVFGGTGTVSGALRSGEFTLTIDGSDMVILSVTDFNMDKFENDGFVNGKFVIEPTANTLSNLDLDDAVISTVKLLDLGIGLDVKSSKGDTSVELSVLSKDEALATISVSAKEKNFSKTELPADDALISAENAFEYLQTIDFGKLCDNLEAAGVPKELVDNLRSMLG